MLFYLGSLSILPSECSASSLFCSKVGDTNFPELLKSGYKLSPLYLFSALNRDKSFDIGEGDYKESQKKK